VARKAQLRFFHGAREVCKAVGARCVCPKRGIVGFAARELYMPHRRKLSAGTAERRVSQARADRNSWIWEAVDIQHPRMPGGKSESNGLDCLEGKSIAGKYVFKNDITTMALF
jgi:hypothetical protein